MNLSRVRAALFRPVSLLTLLLACGATTAPAQTTTWTGGSGNWATGTDWSAGVPDNTFEVFINNGGTVSVTGAAAASEMTVAFGLFSSGLLSISGGNLEMVSHLLLGRNGGTGNAEVTSGSLAVGGFLFTGHVGGTGSFTLSGGDVTSANSFIGYGGEGTVSVTNGTWTTGSIYVGVDATQNGAGVLTLSGGVVTAGSVLLNYSLGYATSTAEVNLNGGVLVTERIQEQSGSGLGELTFNGGTFRATADQTAIFTGFAAGKVQFAAGGATIDTQAFSVETDMGLEGSGGLTKQGSGTLTLSGSSTYTGTTVIEAGTLNLTGSIADSSLTTVGTGAILTGTGVVGDLTIQANGTIAPGSSPGTLNAGNTTFESDGVFQFEINQAGSGVAGTNWDLLSVNGGLTITATSADPFVINLTSLTLSNVAGQAASFNAGASYSFVFVTTTGGITGFSADKFYIDTGDFENAFTEAWTVASDGNNLSLNYNVAVIPEPSTYAALAGLLGLGAVLWRRRSRRSGSAT